MNMPYPDNFSSAALDRAQGRDEDDPPPEDCYDAARGFLDALDRGWLTVDRPNSAYLIGLRQVVASERARRAAAEGRRA